jgi:hypothetical protein
MLVDMGDNKQVTKLEILASALKYILPKIWNVEGNVSTK